MSGRQKQTNPRPTAAELAILDVLWELGASTVREVHQALNPNGQNSYTTTLKLLQIMHGKGLVTRDDSSRAHIYKPALSRLQAQDEFLQDIVHRLFRGSATRLAMRALGQVPDVDSDELSAIRNLVDELEQRRKEVDG
ncbi:MAG: BlaI/MecI/CopY family transcriptional regulator [Xanthomonadales bacterium]|jgi:predicted transcriptional regulator|nr:BlaI/MecI/CopY family transcriptional regulator [Xanthomonadales bacterium]